MKLRSILFSALILVITAPSAAFAKEWSQEEVVGQARASTVRRRGEIRYAIDPSAQGGVSLQWVHSYWESCRRTGGAGNGLCLTSKVLGEVDSTRLNYNEGTGEVTWTSASGRTVVCAEVEQRRRGWFMHSTGACTFNYRTLMDEAGRYWVRVLVALE
jgi:hypothetical protein